MYRSNDRPFVSVVIPAYNEGNRIDMCLTALLAQDYSDAGVEIIVVNNQSSDDTAVRAESYPVTVIHESGMGPACARNAGIHAARGDIIAFVDADCVPSDSWLRELLAGIEDPDIGCFVGEILPLRPARMLAQYIHDRRLICQMRSLMQVPPVAATGNIAYRKTVFETLGLFDTDFMTGEDNDLFWRLVKSDRFRIRYNPLAIVAHAHPSRLPLFARRCFREGIGLARFRWKHREDFPRRFTSRAFVRAAFLRTLAGLVLYPYRVLNGVRKHNYSLPKAVAYPLLDKIVSLNRLAGQWHEFTRIARMPAPPTIPCMNPNVIPATQSSISIFDDQLVMDVHKAPLLWNADPKMQERVRYELSVLGQSLNDLFPDSSILLTGSLFVGEGQISQTPNDTLSQSDYDLFVVTPHARHAIPFTARRKLDTLSIATRSYSTRVTVGVIWLPLLVHRMTTVGGAVIAGNTNICRFLPDLPAPPGFSVLLQAYRLFTMAPLFPDQYSALCARALVRAVRALLCAEKQDRPRREWIGLFRINGVREEIERWKPVLGAELVGFVVQSADYILGRDGNGPQLRYHDRYCHGIREIANRVPLPHRDILMMVKQLLRRLQQGHIGLPSATSARHLIEGLQAVAESWTEKGPDPESLYAAIKIAQQFTTDLDIGMKGDPREVYRSVQRIVADIACFNPHQFNYSPRPGEY
jgi:glycosyltransferase involved in cell wall biosynthesis